MKSSFQYYRINIRVLLSNSSRKPTVIKSYDQLTGETFFLRYGNMELASPKLLFLCIKKLKINVAISCYLGVSILQFKSNFALRLCENRKKGFDRFYIWKSTHRRFECSQGSHAQWAILLAFGAKLWLWTGASCPSLTDTYLTGLRRETRTWRKKSLPYYSLLVAGGKIQATPKSML